VAASPETGGGTETGVGAGSSLSGASPREAPAWYELCSFMPGRLRCAHISAQELVLRQQWPHERSRLFPPDTPSGAISSSEESAGILRTAHKLCEMGTVGGQSPMAGPMQHPDALLADCLGAGPSPCNLHTQGKGGRI